MKTKVLQINENEIGQEAEIKKIEEAGEILRSGGLVAFPTETVYGLGGDALHKEGAKKIYKAKGRPSDNPLIIHIIRLEDLSRIVTGVTPIIEKLLDRFWPGPLTIILKKTEEVPYETSGGLDTVAIRMPDHKIARAIIDSGGGFIAAPSANTSGKPSPTSAAHVVDDLSGRIDMVVDGGEVEIGVESTILDLTVEPPMILRPGAITKEMLEEILPKVVDDPGFQKENERQSPKAPGMKYRHYAPKATLYIVSGKSDEAVDKINQLAAADTKRGLKVGIIGTKENMEQYSEGVIKCIGSRKSGIDIARHLYKVLREFDTEEVDVIYSESFEESGIGKAIMNRLLKAASHQIINS
ncbi:L-threonylcarbamoyladenylate synthase [Aequitasia blattaphilus]|uniref:Threonylcarbamoyl-AMP synthase n=1 Tax=Aequitasia blattaphilus TaxID=2949332 RepID=A0ABT1E981_9FIRM|nr:L-threonylcarbamoyladenylate synthase [Aequitasia blattaphilus]MCP1102389.1 L-threonylcarbamoyladenylate synthase [Aequitasia blattaphilus]MCR8615029.1 L-threonylcarbamoyladenylate synthase [Aequitasia blattaphilus]